MAFQAALPQAMGFPVTASQQVIQPATDRPGTARLEAVGVILVRDKGCRFGAFLSPQFHSGSKMSLWGTSPRWARESHYISLTKNASNHNFS
jgi:hypothetical protein